METASNSESPNNDYGYGIINAYAASEYLPKKSVVIDRHVPLKNTSNTTSPYKVTARIRAERGINPEQLFLYWRTGQGGAFQKTAFTAMEGKTDFFLAFIPPQGTGSTVYYYLAARDSRGKKTALPFEAPDAAFSFLVR